MNSRSKQLRTEFLEPRMLMAADVALDIMPADVAHDNSSACVASYVAGNERGGFVSTRAPFHVDMRVPFRSNGPANHAEKHWPETISLPVGFEPEGITLGKGHDFFAGAFSFSSYLGPLAGQTHPTSPYAGAIYKGDLRTGEGSILVEPTGRPIAGLSYDARTDSIYAAVADPTFLGGPRSNAGIVVYNGTTGEKVDEIIFGDVSVNDVLVTKSAVFGTDSTQAVIYKVPLEGGGRLPSQPTFEEIELTGPQVGASNNGLVGSFDGNDLVVINDASGLLHHIDTKTGAATVIDVDGEQTAFASGDGLYLSGRTLYIMQNQVSLPDEPGKLAVVQLSGDLSEGTFVKDIKNDDLFKTPTTILGFGDSIYAVNSHVLFDGSSEDVIFHPETVQTELVKVHK